MKKTAKKARKATTDASRAKQLRAMNEAQLRSAPTPRPDTHEELQFLIHTMCDRKHDYGSAAEAMAIVAAAAFNYAANKVGASGYQAQYASLSALKRIRSDYEGPIMIVQASDLLYPQYSPIEKVATWMHSPQNRAWRTKKAKDLLADAEADRIPVDKRVLKRWKEIANDK